MEGYDLSRYIDAQRMDYATALKEIRSGRKQSHWMWYIFPQLKGLGHSSMSEFYGIRDLKEARAFLRDEYLGGNLLEITSALLELECSDAGEVMGSPDDLKLRSCMTLFAMADPKQDVFQRVLDKFFGGRQDYQTIARLQK